MFGILIRGKHIMFFEYYNNIQRLDAKKVDHFQGCVSLTQECIVKGKPHNALKNRGPLIPYPLKFDIGQKDQTFDPKDLEYALSYPTPCVFNFNIHPHEIWDLFSYMRDNSPGRLG